MSGGNVGHGWVHPRKDGARARCGGPRMCKQCALEQAQKDSTLPEKPKEEVIVAIALPPRTGQPLTNFTYDGKVPDKKFIRENGPSEAWSNAEED